MGTVMSAAVIDRVARATSRALSAETTTVAEPERRAAVSPPDSLQPAVRRATKIDVKTETSNPEKRGTETSFGAGFMGLLPSDSVRVCYLPLPSELARDETPPANRGRRRSESRFV